MAENSPNILVHLALTLIEEENKKHPLVDEYAKRIIGVAFDINPALRCGLLGISDIREALQRGILSPAHSVTLFEIAQEIRPDLDTLFTPEIAELKVDLSASPVQIRLPQPSTITITRVK